MISKKLIIDRKARRELRKFSEAIQEEFEKRFSFLREYGRLEFPEAKKVTKSLFEIRIKLHGEYRGFYAYIEAAYIVILHAFRKKTQKTPLKSLKVAERRLKDYE